MVPEFGSAEGEELPGRTIIPTVRQSSNYGPNPQFCKRQERDLDFRQAIEIGAQHAAVEKEIGEFSLADDFD